MIKWFKKLLNEILKYMSTLTKTAFEAQYVDNTTGTFADNTSQAISAGDMRQFADDIADSFTYSGGLNFTVVQIGDWDMDSDTGVTVTHGISDSTKIRSVQCIIRGDDATSLYDLSRGGGSATDNNMGGWIGTISSTTVTLIRFTTGYFDNTSFNSTSFNRGWITIGYVD